MVSHRKPAKPAFDPRTVKENIVETPLNEEMSKSFLEYAYSVIYARALPDARDGLKPVQRRIIYQMGQMSLNPDRPYMKSARVVGEVMGKLHPHGDSAIYEAMVRLAQPFAMRLPLVDGHGNFGSLDDGPAASRYTEARMAPAALGMNADIAENTVGFTPNYDNKLQEPTVLPAAIPNLLVNGGSGIAVGHGHEYGHAQSWRGGGCGQASYAPSRRDVRGVDALRAGSGLAGRRRDCGPQGHPRGVRDGSWRVDHAFRDAYRKRDGSQKGHRRDGTAVHGGSGTVCWNVFPKV